MIIIRSRAAAFFMVLTVAGSLRAERHVTVDGVDAGDCRDAPCATLSYAIAQVDEPDLISVGPGTFTNGGAVVNVNKQLRLEGARAGVDARGRTGPESVLTVPVVLSADSVTIIGFTVDCGDCAPAGAGITAASSAGGQAIYGNIVTGNPIGVRIDARNILLAQNHITENNHGMGMLAGAGTGLSMNGVEDFIISDNWIDHHRTANVSLTGVAVAHTGTFHSNLFTQDVVDDGSSIVLSGTSGVLFDNNVITGGTAPIILVGNGNDDLVIVRNSLKGSAAAAIAVAGSSAEPNGSIVIHSNDIADNAIGVDISTSPPTAPVEVNFNRLEDNGTDVRVAVAGATVDGENNWWGCNEGPAACAANAIDAGSTADFDPWLLLTIQAFPNSITPQQTSTVVADFTGFFFPNGVVVSFTASGGTLSPATVLTSGLVPFSTFTPTGPGVATVYATVDDETVAAAILVGGAAAVPALSGPMLLLLAAVLATIALVVLRHGVA